MFLNDVNLTKFDLYKHSYCASAITMIFFVIVTLTAWLMLTVVPYFDHILLNFNFRTQLNSPRDLALIPWSTTGLSFK